MAGSRSGVENIPNYSVIFCVRKQGSNDGDMSKGHRIQFEGVFTDQINLHQIDDNNTNRNYDNYNPLNKLGYHESLLT